ncbi:MAG: RNA degradosome polyphosphate kinase [Actinomycetota bacterium]|nr:RNA degradosome polyphosphate kinase [Actinomycetota bacterium]
MPDPAAVASATRPADHSESELRQTVAPAPTLSAVLPPDRYLNRELSWLEFNARVLALAEDQKLPLLERMKFLAIFASNLDEFYMVRVAGLKRRQSTGLSMRSPDGLSPREQLERITARTRELSTRHATCFGDDVSVKLEEEGICILHWEALERAEAARLREYFRDHVFPVLTPLAVDPAHPFPYISGLSLNLAVLIRDHGGGPSRFARVKVPNNVPRFVSLSDGHSFLPVEDLISAHLPQLFPGNDVIAHHVFRVTRNADFDVEDDRDEDLLQALERELARRRFGPAVRLEITEGMDEEVLGFLLSELGITESDVIRVPGLLDLSALMALYDLDRPGLKDEPFVPATHPRLSDGETPKSVFATLREGDVLVHHPYDSFATSVQRFIEQAAEDPHVLAIKQTLYRTSGDSPIVEALSDAARAGKQVVVIVEIKARFDEAANISWARQLEQAGCHVVYGLVGLKTHCKTALVVRSENGVLRRYCHIGTGNYNPKTARLYEDFGILTADSRVGADLTDLFNALTGYSRQTNYRTLLVSPRGIRQGLLDRIEREIGHARAGRPAGITFKINAVVDEGIIGGLYRASAAGVRVRLLVRGICALRPGVAGFSDNIEVRSIVGRFLEHSRVVNFANDGDPEWWLGSADMMHRNLDRRIEVMLQVTDPVACQQLSDVTDLAWGPSVRCWKLHADGTWTQSGDEDYQTRLISGLVDRDS